MDPMRTMIAGRFGQDLKFGLRLMKRSPAFTAVAVVTLALGIGANTAIFSVMNAMLLRLLPVDQPQQLVQLRRGTAGSPTPPGEGFSYPAYQLFRDGNQVFGGVLAISRTSLQAALGSTESAQGQFVSGNYYQLLGVQAVLGRLITPEDDERGLPVAVISYGLWQSAFGGQSSVIGRQLLVEDIPLTIVGVTPQGFSGLQAGRPQDFAVPSSTEPQLRKNSWLAQPFFNWLAVVGRLKPGATPRQAEANLDAIFKQHIEELIAQMAARGRSRPSAPEEVVTVTPAGAGLAGIRDQYSEQLYLLMAVVGTVLLVACVNLANLLLARAASRRREIAVRLALGAGPTRLVFQLMTEGLLLAVAGGALGLLFADWTSSFLVSFLRGVEIDVRPDSTVLLFTAGVCLAAGVIFGLLPALRTVHADPGPLAKEGLAASGRPGWGRKLPSGFIVAQVALSLILTVGAVLFVSSLRNLQALDPGFRKEHILLVGVNPGKAGYRQERLLNYYEQLLGRVRQLPGVLQASLSMLTPISGGQVDLPVSFEGRSPSAGEVNPLINDVSPGYFETMGTPILSGRDFSTRDSGLDAPPVVLVNQAMASRYFPGENPIGRRIKVGSSKPAEVVGLAKDAKYTSLRELPPPTVYQNCLQGNRLQGSFTLEIYTAGTPSELTGPLRSAIESLDRTVPISTATPFARHLDESLRQEQLLAALAGLFGGLALLMTCIGLYGVLAHTVSRRVREIGIRMALGARRKEVVALILRGILIQVLLGVAFGLPAAIALGRQVADRLYGLKPSDPWTLAGATALMLAVALTAGWLPARRAAAVDPRATLRHE